jgi:adenosylcobyric acid synthase
MHASWRPRGGLGEIGSAQYFQALAAGAAPDVRMNPVLLKPEADTRSQVVVMGEVVPRLASIGWRERSFELARVAREAYLSLATDYEVVVIEGAGSPAETNLAEEDYVNLGAARWSKARCLLVSDIDRGGGSLRIFRYPCADAVGCAWTGRRFCFESVPW